MNSLKYKVYNIKELIDNSIVYCINRPLIIGPKAAKALDKNGLNIIKTVRANLVNLEPWTDKKLTETIKEFAEKSNTDLGKIAQPLRSALCGSMPASGIFEVMKVLGKEETLDRLNDVL